MSHYVTVRPVKGSSKVCAVLTQVSQRKSRAVGRMFDHAPTRIADLVYFPASLTGGRVPSIAQAIAYLNHARPF